MITPVQTSNSSGTSAGGLFRTDDGRNLIITFALVTSLFLLWGFCNGMIDILNKHFQDSLHINKEQSGLVQFANYLGYFLMAIPAGLIARRFGYKGGILLGLILIAGGAFWLIHAAGIGTYSSFLLGLFVIAAGMTCLETIANPYTTVLGSASGGATRINIAQTFNGVGWVLGPIIGGHFLFAGGGNANAGLSTPYLGIGIFAAVWTLVFVFARVPDLRAEEESKGSGELEASIKPTGGQMIGIGIALAIVWGLLYFFIAPILGLVWVLLALPAGLLDPVKVGLLVAAYAGSFFVVTQHWDMFRRKHFTLGVVAQFLYVAAQTGIFSFCVNYVLENDASVTPARAATWLGAIGFVLFTAGRACGSVVISLFKPHLVLAAYAVINVGLTAVAMKGGELGMVALFGTFFFMSVMYPTIFALGIRGLGNHTKLGSSLIVMSIVGGAIAPPFMGHIADVHSMRIGFVVPLVCFVCIAVYGVMWPKLEANDSSN
jgi:FHS family L-fucose permease-like MFS transporter